METIWTPNQRFVRASYDSEADLESAIAELQQDLFGVDRVYFDIKKKIGVRGGQRNIPDGYLLDLRGRIPRLYVVEVELASHDPLRHIAVQILQFSLAFEQEPRRVKFVLHEALAERKQALAMCNAYSERFGYRGLDHLLERLVYDTPFAALVIIDEIPENLRNVLQKKFQFGVEVLELARYETQGGTRIYRFEPFLADVDFDAMSANAAAGRQALEVGELDTVVVPARDDGFKDTFIGEDRWHEIRLHSSMRPQIKYIAAYRVAPVSAITHVAPVASIEPWKDTDKYVVNFSAPAKEIGPVRYVSGGRVNPLQNIRYTNLELLKQAQTLDDLW